MEIDQIIRTKRKGIALIVKRDGKLVVRAPLNATDAQILALVEKKKDWIQTKQKMVSETYPKAAPKEYVNGEGFWFLGKTYRLEIVEKADKPLDLFELFLLDSVVLPKANIVFTNWYREQALKIISERVTWYAAKYGLSYKQVKITSAKTRWGSCSSKGTISFAWRLVMAPVPIIDYVVVHELVHMVEKNHGKPFWAKVKAIMPDYKQRIEWLENNENILCL
jgi:predicted metal-dependent hydrolase